MALGSQVDSLIIATGGVFFFGPRALSRVRGPKVSEINSQGLACGNEFRRFVWELKTRYNLREKSLVFFVSVSRGFSKNIAASTQVVARATCFRGFSGGAGFPGLGCCGSGSRPIRGRYSDQMPSR